MLRHCRIQAWWPVLLWMLAIYIGSTDVLSSQRTSRVIGPLLLWLMPDLSESAIRTVQFVLRKCAHIAEYAALAIFCRRALHSPPRLFAPWEPRKAAIAWIISAIYAVSDELHQAMISSRYGSAMDVLFDVTGAALGLGVIWLVLWARRGSRQGRLLSSAARSMAG